MNHSGGNKHKYHPNTVLYGLITNSNFDPPTFKPSTIRYEKNFLLLALVIWILFSCKKEIKELKADDTRRMKNQLPLFKKFFMKKVHLFIAAVTAVAITACKKDIQTTSKKEIETSNQRAKAINTLTLCFGNVWAADQDFDGYSTSPSLVYNNKVYVFNNPGPGNISIYDGTTWTTIVSAIPLSSVWVDFAFVIGNKGYLGYTHLMNGCYEYDFVANTWTPKANFPGPVRSSPSYFSVGSKGYVVAGHDYPNGTEVNYRDTWEYNPATNNWTQKANFPFLFFGRFSAAGFSIGNKGYIINGRVGLQPADFFLKSLMEYDPSTNTWSSKADFPGEERTACKTFVISGYAYVGGGFNYGNDSFQDFYKYNPVTDTWTNIAAIPVTGYLRQSFSINSKGYVVQEYQNNPNQLKMEKYTPLTCPLVQ